GPYVPILQASSSDLIIEHLRSQFYEANLSALPNLDLRSQHLLVMFHDLLRVTRERLGQLAPLVRDAESNSAQSDNKQRDAAIQKLTGVLVWTLENVLLHGWAAQEHLDHDGRWKDEFELDPTALSPIARKDWIGGIRSLIETKKRAAPARDDIH